MKKIVSISVLLTAVIASQNVQAAGLDSGDMLNRILDSFSNVAATWHSNIQAAASWLFWGLALISMIWTYGLMIMRKADIQEVFGETIRFFATLGFYWWILVNGPAISLSIINTMRTIGAQASGVSNGLSPSGIVDIGFSILTKVSDSASLLSPVVSAVMLVAAICVLVTLALIAVNMLLLLVSAWFLAYAGVFLLGFGGSRWTSDIAINFYKSVLGIGIQLFTMILLIGIGKSFIDQYYAAFQTGTPDLNSLCVLLVASVVLLALVNKLPPMLASIVGSSGHSAGIGSFGAGAAIGAAAMAASAAASAGATTLVGANQAAGAMSALSAAFKAAQEGAGSSAADTGTLPADDGPANSSTGGASSLAAAMGSSSSPTSPGGSSSSYEANAIKAGKLAMQAGASLAGRTASLHGNAASEGLSQSFGGRVASAIGAAHQRSESSNRTPEFSGDSVGSGRDEIADFVNHKPPQD